MLSLLSTWLSLWPCPRVAQHVVSNGMLFVKMHGALTSFVSTWALSWREKMTWLVLQSAFYSLVPDTVDEWERILFSCARELFAKPTKHQVRNFVLSYMHLKHYHCNTCKKIILKNTTVAVGSFGIDLVNLGHTSWVRWVHLQLDTPDILEKATVKWVNNVNVPRIQISIPSSASVGFA